MMKAKKFEKTTAMAMALAACTYAPNTSAQEQNSVGPTGPNPPPSIETKSPGGVNMTTGAYSMQSVDLQIGEGAFPNGLSLLRSYNSSTGQSYLAYSQGWSHNWHMRVTVAEWPIPEELDIPCGEDLGGVGIIYQDSCKLYYHVVSFGNGSAKYTNDGVWTHTGSNIPGVYRPLEEHNLNQQLEFIGNISDPNVHNNGHYEFTDSDGTLYIFNPLAAGGGGQRLSRMIAPNGTSADLTYKDSRLKSVFTSDGYGLIFEYNNPAPGFYYLTKSCVVNRADTPVLPDGDCPSGALSVSYAYSSVRIDWHDSDGSLIGSADRNALTSVTDALGQTTSYEYDDGGHIDCVKDPGQSKCRIRMTYGQCRQNPDYEPASPVARAPEMHLDEKVLRQDLATGEYWVYSGNPIITCPHPYGSNGGGSGSFIDALGNETRILGGVAKPIEITNPLGHKTVNQYRSTYNPGPPSVVGEGLLISQTLPEGNVVTLDYDSRGNLTSSSAIDKSGSANVLTTSATYASVCTPTSRKTCNKPLSQTDAKGNVSNFEYSDDHGGVTRMLGPVVDGVRPETRYSYVQKYAWLKTANGSYEQAATPFWVLAEERSCSNSAMNASGNCAVSSDLVVTAYEYDEGNASKGSNVWLLGTAVTAANSSGQSETLRSCYTYDNYGRKVSESQPKANLASCN